MANPGAVHKWVRRLPERGRYAFSAADVIQATGVSAAAARAALHRLKRTNTIVSPRRGFFVVVPAEYQSAGSLPASWFLDDLMEHLGRSYYVGLLSAAALHGAGHQQPMALQVIVDRTTRDIAVGRVRVEFHTSEKVASAKLDDVQTETGSMRVSTAETTAVDIVRFASSCGSWSNIATVLGELAEVMSTEELGAACTRAGRSDRQRLGWLLEVVDEHALASEVFATLRDQRLLPTPLNPRRGTADVPLDEKWRILVNDDVEPDL